MPASLRALAFNPKLTLLLVGHPDSLSSASANQNAELLSRLRWIPAYETVAGDAKPSQAIRQSKRHIHAYRAGTGERGEACVSAPETPGADGAGKLMLKSIEGIERPALMTVVRNQKKGKTLMLLVWRCKCGVQQ